MFVINTAYNSLLKGWKEKKLIHETIFMKVLFFIELCDQLLLKKQEMMEKTEEVIRLVLKDLPTVLQTPAATFENILFFLSFCTRFHFNTLQKGQEDGLALQVLRSLLTKIVQLNRNSLRTKNLMNKYWAKLNNLIPNCPPTHYVFNQLQSMEREAIFQREEWILQVTKFFRLKQPVSGMKNLVCLTASSIKASANGDGNLLDLPNELQHLLKLH